jgi:hypothetical protein
MLFLNLLDDKVHLVFSQQRPGPLLCYHLQMSEVGLQVSKVIHPMGVVSLKSENDIMWFSRIASIKSFPPLQSSFGCI